MQIELNPEEWVRTMKESGKTLPQIFEECGQPVPEWAKENGWEKLLNSENSPKIGATPNTVTVPKFTRHNLCLRMEWMEDEYDEGWVCPICKDKRTWQVLDEYKGEYCPYCGQHLSLPKTMFKDGYR